jgi:hypothetical protein
MNNFARLPPLGQKQPKPKADPAYLARVRELPCCVCEAFGERQIGPSFSHHVICGRFSQRKTPDRMAISLCYDHHQGARGIHTDKSAWVQEYGKDHEYTAATKDRLGV